MFSNMGSAVAIPLPFTTIACGSGIGHHLPVWSSPSQPLPVWVLLSQVLLKNKEGASLLFVDGSFVQRKTRRCGFTCLPSIRLCTASIAEMAIRQVV